MSNGTPMMGGPRRWAIGCCVLPDGGNRPGTPSTSASPPSATPTSSGRGQRPPRPKPGAGRAQREPGPCRRSAWRGWQTHTDHLTSHPLSAADRPRGTDGGTEAGNLRVQRSTTVRPPTPSRSVSRCRGSSPPVHSSSKTRLARRLALACVGRGRGSPRSLRGFAGRFSTRSPGRCRGLRARLAPRRTRCCVPGAATRPDR